MDTQRTTRSDILRLVLVIYFPTFVMHLGWGMIIPVIPLYARGLGASLAAAGLVVALKGIGPLVMNIPSGILLSRFGNRKMMMAAAVLGVLVAVGMGLSVTVVELAALSLLLGGLQTVWSMVTVSFVRAAVPVERRGRAIASIGGINRIGDFLGPIAGGFLGKFVGLSAVFYAQSAVTLAVLLAILVVGRGPFGAADFRAGGTDAAADAAPREGTLRVVWRLLVDHRRSFAAAGSVAVTFGLLRSARQIVFPLWGDVIGMDVAAIGLIVGFSSAIDMTLFYPAGMLMDRRGRKWSAVPSLAIMAASFLLIPFCTSFASLVAVGLLVGIGNGLGSGIVMTIGTDLAPEKNTGEFLGLWFLVSGFGSFVGPLVIGVLADFLSMGAASVTTAVVGAAGALYMAVFVPEPSKRPRTVSGRRYSRRT